jgi:hypothetical protein
MKIISHRGNLTGPNQEEENKMSYIDNSLSLGYDVEIDLWYVNGEFYLGHDNPVYRTNFEFISKNGLWIHAKNLDALYQLTKTNLHYFWHQNDDFTLTSKNIIWTYPDEETTKNSVIVTLENNINKFLNLDIYGVCADYITT